MLKDYSIFNWRHEYLRTEVANLVSRAFDEINDGSLPVRGDMRSTVLEWVENEVDNYASGSSDEEVRNLVDECRLTEDELRYKATHIYRMYGYERTPENITNDELAATAIMRGFEDYWPDPNGDPDANIEDEMKPDATRRYVVEYEETYTTRFTVHVPTKVVTGYSDVESWVDAHRDDFARELENVQCSGSGFTVVSGGQLD